MTGASDCRGIPVSYPVANAIEGLDRAQEMSLAFRGDAIAEIDKVIAEHPSFIMAHLFKAAWLTQAMETRIYDDMVKAVQDAENLIGNGNDREKGHLPPCNAGSMAISSERSRTGKRCSRNILWICLPCSWCTSRTFFWAT